MLAADPALTSRERWTIAARRAGTHSLLLWPPLTIAYMVLVSARKGSLGIDFAQAYLPAAHRVLHGLTPYPPATLHGVAGGLAFVYPPLTAWIAAPFAALPLPFAEALVTALMIVVVVATLLLLDVRDWRCHMIAFLWVPTYAAIQTANLSLPIALGLAALWRYRNRLLVSALVAGALVALKLYLWPVVLWLALTRRLRSAALASVTAVLLVAVSWATIGFAGLTTYPRLLHVLTVAEGRSEYTLQALLTPALSWGTAEAISVVAGIVVIAVGARRGERVSYVCAMAATALLTPIAHMSYFVILLVPIALRDRRLSPLWAVPLALWFAPQVADGRFLPTLFALAVVSATLVAASRERAR
jgi:hypothetical protein